LKDYIEGEMLPEKMIIDEKLLSFLEKECLQIKQVCTQINNDSALIQKINLLANNSNSNSYLYKSEQFFISDCINLYYKKTETEKSRFVLAYYYDALRNNHLADAKAIKTLNKLAVSDDFKNHINKIKAENVIKSDKTEYFLPNFKEEFTKSYESFINFSFDIKPELNSLKSENNLPKNANITEIPANDTLEKAVAELNELIGLETVKKDVNELINLLNIQKKRKTEGLKNIEITLHTVFLGPPGTGKTTVARLLGRIFKHLGFLSKGQLYETDREGMIAGFVGQTATKVDKVVEESKGGVLFIDEAYALTNNSLGNDYGSEAVNILLKRMEDHRSDFAVVVAGYTEPMKLFIESNPGLRSRFNRFFHFDHFKPFELFQIFENFCKNADFIISEDAKEKLNDTFELLFEKKDDSFGNARVVRNLFEKCVQNQANRIVKLSEITPEILKTLTEDDIPEPKETEKLTNFTSR
jgi:SpoVK/Ycf46/Vps4 family AAA+-type ATPase